MARAKPQRTKYPGIYKRETTHGTVYDIVYRANGKQKPIRGKHTNLEQAHKHRLDLLFQAHHGTLPDAEPKTFDAFAEEWEVAQDASVAQGGLRSSTVRTRKHELKKYLRPALGEKPLHSIGAGDVERLINELSASGLSNHTVLRIARTLNLILEAARRHGHIRVNPVPDARRPPAKRKREPQRLSPKQVLALADAATELKWIDERNLILVAAFQGLRQAELFGLHWPNVDLTDGAERVKVAEQFYEGELVDRPKTPAGLREAILAAPEAAEALRSQQVEGRSSDAAIVFPSPDGTYWRASNFNRRRWQTIRERAGLPDLHFHDLRHFFVSYVRQMNLPPALTKQMAGHSDDAMHDGYTHAIPGTEPLIRQRFADATAARESEAE